MKRKRKQKCETESKTGAENRKQRRTTSKPTNIRSTVSVLPWLEGGRIFVECLDPKWEQEYNSGNKRQEWRTLLDFFQTWHVSQRRSYLIHRDWKSSWIGIWDSNGKAPVVPQAACLRLTNSATDREEHSTKQQYLNVCKFATQTQSYVEKVVKHHPCSVTKYTTPSPRIQILPIDKAMNFFVSQHKQTCAVRKSTPMHEGRDKLDIVT